jgi:hypothetical protein
LAAWDYPASPHSAMRQVSPLAPPRICLRRLATPLHQSYHSLAGLPSCVTPSLGYYRFGSRAGHPPTPEGARGDTGRLASPAWPGTRSCGYGNINPLSIDYACRPRLRSRLTLGGLAWPRNPWSSGGGVSHSPFATHACILTAAASTTGSPRRFTRRSTLPYPPTRLHTPRRECGSSGVNATASVVCLSPATLSAQDHLTSELLRTLSRMAASKPTSWLSVRPHILSHLAHAPGP